MNAPDEIMLYIDSHGRIWSPAGGEGILYIRKTLHDEQVAEKDRRIAILERALDKLVKRFGKLFSDNIECGACLFEIDRCENSDTDCFRYVIDKFIAQAEVEKTNERT